MDAVSYDIVVINLCFSVSAGISGLVLWCLLSPLSCPLNPQPIEAGGSPSWVWFSQRFLPVKREFFLSTVASGTLRTGDWTKEKFQCNLYLSIARILFLNWLYMNELDLFWIQLIGFYWIMITMNWTLIPVSIQNNIRVPQMHIGSITAGLLCGFVPLCSFSFWSLTLIVVYMADI